jgi:tetratricopeptide (TPR) repeat protein
MVDHFVELIEWKKQGGDWPGLRPDFVFQAAADRIDWRGEVAATRVDEELARAADLISSPRMDSEGRSPLLYPSNARLTRQAEESAREKRLAAWYYLDARYTNDELLSDRLRSERYVDLGYLLVPALLRSGAAADRDVAEVIRGKVKATQRTLAHGLSVTDILRVVQRLQRMAKASVAFEDYGEALESLQQAVDLLDETLRRDGLETDERRALGRTIADCLGMAGGNSRRLGKLQDAVNFYRRGYGYEADPMYGIVDSYNLTNWIVLRILSGEVEVAELSGDVANGVRVIEEQVGGTRRDQWWAWADLGLVSLLAGDYDRAQRAYERFRSAGARAQDYHSTLAVLTQLEPIVRKQSVTLANAFAQATAYLEEQAAA